MKILTLIYAILEPTAVFSCVNLPTKPALIEKLQSAGAELFSLVLYSSILSSHKISTTKLAMKRTISVTQTQDKNSSQNKWDCKCKRTSNKKIVWKKRYEFIGILESI